MSDAQLTRLWRRTERFTEASLVVTLLFAGAFVYYDWPDWVAFFFGFPLWAVTLMAALACWLVLRPWMDRRGLDWEAPVWWVR